MKWYWIFGYQGILGGLAILCMLLNWEYIGGIFVMLCVLYSMWAMFAGVAELSGITEQDF